MRSRARVARTSLIRSLRIRKLLSFDKVYGFFRSEAKVCWPAIEVPTLECIQLGHDRGSRQHALQCCKQPLRVVLFKVKLMCGRRGEDLKEDQLMRVAP